MTALITEGQVGAIGWIALAWLFLVLGVSIPLIRAARARGKRLFVDGPTKRSKALLPDTRFDHTMDGWD